MLFRQFITRFSQSDWLLDVFKIHTSIVVRSDVYGNCPNLINNGSAYSELFQSTPGLFSALANTLEHSTTSGVEIFFTHWKQPCRAQKQYWARQGCFQRETQEGGGRKTQKGRRIPPPPPPFVFFFHHPETPQAIKLKLSDFKDKSLRHTL